MRRTVDGTQYMTIEPNVLENLRSELRREQYGYTLRKALAEHGMDIDEGTLYPLLRRLETQGLLVSEWREEDKRNRRFYHLSETGTTVLRQLLFEWGRINSSLERILQEA